MRAWGWTGVAAAAWMAASFNGLCDPAMIPLEGEWQIRMDQAGSGIAAGWPAQTFTGDVARLPGTVASNRRVPPAATPAPGHANMHGLTTVYPYSGAVWYQREIVIPESWRGTYAELFLERCQWETFVWVDGQLQGTRNSLVAPHVYDLTRALTPGTHRLTVLVDNANRNTGMKVGPDNLIKYLDLTTEVKKGAKLNCAATTSGRTTGTASSGAWSCGRRHRSRLPT